VLSDLEPREDEKVEDVFEMVVRRNGDALRYRAAAERAGLSVEEWVRAALDAAAS